MLGLVCITISIPHSQEALVWCTWGYNDSTQKFTV